MYLSFATFAVYWYPVLMALGIYCLLDGKYTVINHHIHHGIFTISSIILIFIKIIIPITIDTFTNYSGIQSSWSLSLMVNHHVIILIIIIINDDDAILTMMTILIMVIIII